MTDPSLRVLQLSRAAIGRLALAGLTGTGAAVSGIGLMAASAWLISRAAQHPPVLHLTMAIVAVRTFGLGRAVLRYVERITGHDAAFRVLTALRVRAYEGLERIAPAGLRGLRSGDLVSRFVTDVDASMDLLTRIALPALVAGLAGAATVIFLAALLPAAGLVLLLGLAAVAIGLPALQTVLIRRADERTASLRGDLTDQIVELVHGAPDLLIAGAAPARLATAAGIDRRLRRASARSSLTLGLSTALVGLVSGGCVWLALTLGTAAVRHSTLDGVLLAVVVLTPLAAFEAVSALPVAAGQLGPVRSALSRVFSIVDSPAPAPEPAVPATVPAGPYHLRLDRVTARWNDTGPDAVQDLTLDLPPGRRIALVGPSGCGKSTVAALLVRFLDPARGQVSLNGRDLRSLSTEDVRQVVGLVAEDAHVFDTTVRENLRVGRPDASEADLRAALAAVRLLDWADRLPGGLDTPVGERGERLSGGERRRLVLARALLADFPVLVLDEPTEHLDRHVADEIMADLLSATTGRTILFITHQTHGLGEMDEIVHLLFPDRTGRDQSPATAGR
jgi:thiol reductant ABC exporter CydC subunit